MSTAPLLDPPHRPLDLRAQVLEVGRRWATAQYRLVHLAATLDTSGEWAIDRSRTCAHWLADALDVEVSTAREWVRIGHLLARLPTIETAFAEQRISYTKVRQLTRVADPDNEAELTAIAERTRAGRLAAAIAAWLARDEAPEDTERRLDGLRSLTYRTDPDGMIAGTFRLPPHVAARPIAAIDAWIMQRTSLDDPLATTTDPATDGDGHASTDASPPPTVTTRRAWPTIAQQRADGLVALLEGGGGALGETEVVLHVRADGCTLDDGTPIAGSIVERIASDAFISLLIHDAERRPINASGRQRHPTRRQKRVIHERDGGCVDCGATSLLQHDHDPAFAITRRTLVDEVKERCWPCHRARHAAEDA